MTKQVGCINKSYNWGWQDEASCYYGFGGCPIVIMIQRPNAKGLASSSSFEEKAFEILMGIKYYVHTQDLIN
jgi:hypothetical protein